MLMCNRNKTSIIHTNKRHECSLQGTYLKVDDDDDEGYLSKSRNMTFIIFNSGKNR